MTGHPDTDKWDTTATCDLHEKHRDRDRDAAAAIEHLVEIRVPRVIVRPDVSPDAECLEYECTDRIHIGPPYLRREGIEPLELRVHVEGGVAVGRDQQRGLVERYVLLGAGHEFSPSRRVLHGKRLYKPCLGCTRLCCRLVTIQRIGVSRHPTQGAYRMPPKKIARWSERRGER